MDEHEEPIDLLADESLAWAIQHEVDHLDGKLYLDGLTGTERAGVDRSIMNAPWRSLDPPEIVPGPDNAALWSLS